MQRVSVRAVAVSLLLLVGCHEDQPTLGPTSSEALPAAVGGPRGFIEEPRIGSYFGGPGSNHDRVFLFTGWVDFGPGDGRLELSVEQFGNGVRDHRGRLVVKLAQPSSETKIVAGRKVWKFSIGPLEPFSELMRVWEFSRPRPLPPPQPWPDGGTGKIHIYARRFSDQKLTRLPGRDRQGVKGQPEGPSLVFSDLRFVLDDPPYLGRKETGIPYSTEDYYKSVYVTANGSRVEGLSIRDFLPTLGAFKARYFGRCENLPDTLRVEAPPATYFNKGDLGIGRKMSCRYNPCPGSQETACYVENYGDELGNPFFTTDPEPSRKAIKENKPFATVAMVSRGLMDADAANKVFFVVYDPSGKLQTGPAPLDNRKHNTTIPGNCVGCHGATAKYNRDKQEITAAYFLPFDLQHALDFYGTTSSDPLSRAAQEGKFKTLNRIIAKTDLYTLSHAKALLNGFYGEGQDFDVNLAGKDWRLNTFKDDWAPNAWLNRSGRHPRQLYRRVIAPYCRTCHISHDEKETPRLAFGSHDDFNFYAAIIRVRACITDNKFIMPNAELTSHQFWASDARAHLVQRANASFPGCGPGGLE
jgi:hypothetical protein